MRVNVVNPTMIGNSVDTSDQDFPGMRPASMDELVGHYLQCVQGSDTGRVFALTDSRWISRQRMILTPRVGFAKNEVFAMSKVTAMARVHRYRTDGS
jgi:hypothetical protein